MIKAVRVTNAYGNSILMRLDFPFVEQGPFTLFSIDGLDQGISDIRATELATMDGAVFNSARQGTKEITLTVILNNAYSMNLAPNTYSGTYNIQNAREIFNKYFPLKTKTKLGIYLNDPVLSQYSSFPQACYMCDGYIKEVRTDIFSKQCAARVTISMLYPKFYYVGTQANIVTDVHYDTSSLTYVYTVTISDQMKAINFLKASGNAKFQYNTAVGGWIYNGQAYTISQLSEYGISISNAIFNNNSYFYINTSFNAFSSSLEPKKFYSNAEEYGDTDSLDCFEIDNSGYSDSDPIYADIIIPIGIDIPAGEISDYKPQIHIGNNYRVLQDYTVVDLRAGNPYIKLFLYNLLSYSEFATRGLKAGDIIMVSSRPGKRDIGIRLVNTTTDISINGLLSQQTFYQANWPYVLPSSPYLYTGLFVPDYSGSSIFADHYVCLGNSISTYQDDPPDTLCIGYYQEKRGL